MKPKKQKNKCIFCEKEISKKEIFRRDFILIPWHDDEADPKSFNKLAKCCHPECLKRFVELNFQKLKEIILSLCLK